MIAATSLADALLTGVVVFVAGAVVLTMLMIGALRRVAEHDAIMRRPVQPAPGPSSTHSNRINITIHGGVHVNNGGARSVPSIEELFAELPAASTPWDRHELGSPGPRRELDR